MQDIVSYHASKVGSCGENIIFSEELSHSL